MKITRAKVKKKKNGEWFFRLSAAVKSGIFRAPSSARRISQEPITAEEMKFIETSILKDWWLTDSNSNFVLFQLEIQRLS